MPLTVPLHLVGDHDRPLVGGKAANLAVLIRAKLPVPTGFCVTATAFLQFLDACPRPVELSELLSLVPTVRPHQATQLSHRLRSCVQDSTIPTAVQEAVLTAWQTQGEAGEYAVRSSATVEDAVDHSFAGQFDSCLKVRGAGSLLVALRKCWLSLFSPRALAYFAKEQFMSEHGHHCRGELELFNPRWSEKPDYILGVVRHYLTQSDQADPLANHQRLAREREAVSEHCRNRLRNPVKRWIFMRSLRRAQKLTVNREEWKNQGVRVFAVMRRVLLALGERLVNERVLGQRDDILFLALDEIGPLAAGQVECDVRATVRQRRGEYERNLTFSPPPVVFGRFDPTKSSRAEPDRGIKTWPGIPVFPGLVTGRARVILLANDQEQLLPGEILVAPFTDPAWTPYFVTAAGVVMDQGGILSHGSIVAREYGLPCVTNVGSATKHIHTGDWIQVDGNRGQVTILNTAAQAT